MSIWELADNPIMEKWQLIIPLFIYILERVIKGLVLRSYIIVVSMVVSY